MSLYSDTSKKIGSKFKQCAFPTVDQATAMCQAALEGNVVAFETVFNWYRHLPSPPIEATDQLSVITLLVKKFPALQAKYEEL